MEHECPTIEKLLEVMMCPALTRMVREEKLYSSLLSPLDPLSMPLPENAAVLSPSQEEEEAVVI